MRLTSINPLAFKSLAVVHGTPANLDKMQQVIDENNEHSLAVRINDGGQHKFFTIYATGEEDVEKLKGLIGDTFRDEAASFLPEGKRYRNLTRETTLAGVRRLLPELPEEIIDAKEVWDVIVHQKPLNKVFDAINLRITNLK